MNRRIARTAGAAFILAGSVALAACSSDTGSTPTTDESAAPAAGAFEYTDSRGETVSLDSAPEVVVAQASVAAALWDAGFQVDGAYGELAPDADGNLDYQSGSLDLDAIEVIGSTYGEFDVEKYALLNPELIVDYTFDGSSLWYVPAAQSEQILALAPSIAVNGTYETTDSAIETFVDLAGKLGADVESDELAADKQAYEDALAAVSEVAASSGLKVAVMSPGVDSLYVANAAYLPEFGTLRGQGLDILDPVNADEQVFTQYSWEEASDYADADIILVDARGYEAAEADLLKIPTWANLPAVKAGQVYNWYAAAPYSYKAYATIYQEIADELKAAEDL